ncbi:CoA-transferase [Cupriavidus sp. SK-3]|uniref:CaiB/BaiF CoA transferase family protein n=1 Tax=Cupriavidus sp. SK-3 TaxID=1470558 RepID=UPI0004451EF0|nr:CaiB/BaiF CoA-transferase family protein [Cupriavidus sp. SK-3]KDP85195.1 CoA-transferase [Cupriavidus sp. SK-3]
MSQVTEKKGPLAAYKVLDLTRVRAGPTAMRQFADWGADVIKIETPEHLEQSDGWGGLRDGADFQNLHRNKRSITLNLKDSRGREVLQKLVTEADVVAENFRPDVKFRLGVDYESLKKVNPRIVYASISGFGQDGPYVKRPGFDHIIQGMGGMMSMNGYPENGPTRVGIAVSDMAAGLYCALGVMTALLERERSGEGQWVQVSLLQSMLALQDFQAARWLFHQEIPDQPGNDHPTSIPTGVYPTADGYITIAAGEQAMFKRLCDTMQASDLWETPEFSTEASRSIHRKALNAELSNRTRARTSAAWLEIFEQGSVAAGPINTMDKVFDDPQVKHLEVAQPLTHPTLGPINVVGQPFKLTRTPPQMRSSAPVRGEHTDEVLASIGFSPSDILALRAGGTV